MEEALWRYVQEVLRKLDRIAHVVEMARLEAATNKSEVDRADDIGKRRLEGMHDDIRCLLERGERSDRSVGTVDDTGKLRLEWMHDDIRRLLERRERTGSSGRLVASAISGGFGGFLLCGAMAMALGLVDGGELRGVWQSEPASVSRGAGWTDELANPPPIAGPVLVPGERGVRTPPIAVPQGYLREAERIAERGERHEAFDVEPVFEGPGVERAPPIGKAVEAVRAHRGPEEFLGRPEDRVGLHRDVLMDAAP